MSWISDSRGFSYTILVEKTKVTAKTDTSVDEYILEVHSKALEYLQSHLLLCLAPQTELDKFAKLLSAGRLKRLLRKYYNLILETVRKLGGVRMASPQKKDLLGELLANPAWLKGDRIDWSTAIDGVKQALKDLTRLTITTTGADSSKTIETTIKLSGDIVSTNPFLSDEQLVAYHERMSKLSIEIMKTYAQIFVQIVSVFVPWAGLKIPTEAITNFQNLIKGISLPSTEK